MSYRPPGSSLRRLLPATEAPNRETSLPLPPSTRAAKTSGSKPHVPAACNTCRKRKIKCSAERPACAACQQRDLVCVYATISTETHAQALKRKYDDFQTEVSTHKELFRLLQELPAHDAQDVLQRLRNGADVGTLVNQMKSADLLLQLALIPETSLRYEFPHVLEMPPNLLHNNPYLDSLIYEAASLYPRSPDQEVSPGTGSARKSPKHEALSKYQSPYLKPLLAAEVVEPRLSAAKPSLWTTVCSNDELMRQLLCAFFRCEYTFHALFQKDYFLEDMASVKSRFCSSLLVNAVLAYACTCDSRMYNRAEYWNPASLSYLFLAEAKRLWELEANEPRLTTVQAGLVLTTVYDICGLDELGRAYSVQAIALAHKLRLFDSNVEIRSKKTRDARAFTAWALYMFEVNLGYHFMHVPLLKDPPSAPLPDPSVDSRWYGEIWVKYPLSDDLWPLHFGHYFKARCEFRVIMSAMCQAFFAEESQLTIEQADDCRVRFDEWYENLPDCLKPKYILHPSHFQTHFYYHNLMISLYQPFVAIETDREPSPAQMVSDATRKMHTLLRIYYLRHSFEATDVFILQPLALAGFFCLSALKNETRTEELESTRALLILVIKGLRDQGRNFYLAETIYRVIQGQMRAEDTALMNRMISVNDGSGMEAIKGKLQAVHSSWPVSIVSKTEDWEVNKLAQLVEQFVSMDSRSPIIENLDSEYESS